MPKVFRKIYLSHTRTRFLSNFSISFRRDRLPHLQNIFSFDPVTSFMSIISYDRGIISSPRLRNPEGVYMSNFISPAHRSRTYLEL